MVKKIIILTGLTGSGKTTLAKKLEKYIRNSVLLYFDSIKTNSYDLLGFRNVEEKDYLKSINKEYYKKLLEELVRRNQEVIITEFPFNISWKNYFKELSKNNNYDCVTINLYAENFDILWEQLKNRDTSEERHPGHYLKEYNIGDKHTYKPKFEFKYDYLKKDYENNIYTSIDLGTIINIKDVKSVNIDDLIKKINNN